jgi:hypothetical protein
MDVSRDERSLGELFSELSQKTSILIRQELLLAKTEMAQKATQIGRDAAFLGVGGAVAYAAALTGAAAIVLLLVRFGVAPWLAAVLTALLLGIMGFVLIRSRLESLKRQQVTPVETVDSLKETAQWLKNETR